MSDDTPAVYRGDPRVPLIAASFARLVGRPLIEPDEDVAATLWRAPAAIVAHGTEADPLFFFANMLALERFEACLEQFLGMPSRLSAQAPLREERQTLLDRVARDGFIDDYAGVRVTLSGRRFEIGDAVVWNLIDPAGALHGQAAVFSV